MCLLQQLSPYRKTPLSAGDAQEHRKESADLEHELIVGLAKRCADPLATQRHCLVDHDLRGRSQLVPRRRQHVEADKRRIDPRAGDRQHGYGGVLVERSSLSSRVAVRQIVKHRVHETKELAVAPVRCRGKPRLAAAFGGKAAPSCGLPTLHATAHERYNPTATRPLVTFVGCVILVVDGRRFAGLPTPTFGVPTLAR